ncbi:unnamed protein product [Schistocephalus solidus]|uniref:Ecdysone-induced protein 74EF n=1 Tax=Schistocephalus solidus TaxID=70667 RepID=A0A183SG74_SCHSO|nr:unnamed protein product [Schistocephalus solidus]
MPVSGVGGHPDACAGDYLGMGSCGLGVAPSSSMSGLLDQYTHLTPGALTSSSSGHLVQDLEDLSLTASCTGDLHSLPPPPPPPPHHHLHSESICGPPDDSHLPHLPQTHSQQQQQQQQIFRGASNVLVMNDLAQGSCFSVVAGQHSHQSSMDSGVGQSVVGHSSCGSSQTPEHVKISRYDPSKSRLLEHYLPLLNRRVFQPLLSPPHVIIICGHCSADDTIGPQRTSNDTTVPRMSRS